MYSYHGSSSTGFRRGHGGKNYRPPPERRNKSITPPPIKECTCLVEINLDEYNEISAPRPRTHQSFCRINSNNDSRSNRNGHSSMSKVVESLKKKCREMRVHLIIPGRNQSGPVSLVGGSYQDVLQATKWLLERIVAWDTFTSYTCDSNSNHVNATIALVAGEGNGTGTEILKGRIIMDITAASHDFDDDDNNNKKTGYFFRIRHDNDGNIQSTNSKPQWLFQCMNKDWSILTCHYIESELDPDDAKSDKNGKNNDDDDDDSSNGERHINDIQKEAIELHTIESLITCVDNVKFRKGINNDTEQLHCWIDHDDKSVFTFGTIEHAALLLEEINSI
mmetsp:Transcript_1009/g.1391  ORF Transcript_1009/g.1391 Transcript_1009/m.1391 type:complete len:335 (+) Transcript_1009:90-1094(+)